MNEIDLTIILPLRDKERRLIKNCLDSLARQDPLPKVIIVDMGSKKELISWIKEYISPQQVTLIEAININKKFNLARACNIGLKNTKTTYVAFSNIDCIYAEDFMKMLVPFLKDRIIVTCILTDLNKDGELDKTSKIHRSKYAVGQFLFTSTEWAMKAHGMDEYYEGWSFEDIDYLQRAQRDGLCRIELSRYTKLYHQWHDRPSNKELKEDIERNRKWFLGHRGIVVRNLDSWGEL